MGPALKKVTTSLPPFNLLLRRKRSRMARPTNVLVALRVTFVASVASLCLIGLVIAKLDPVPDPRQTRWVTALILVEAVIAFGLILAGRRLPLKGSTQQEISAAFRSAFFVGLLLGESIALSGFIGTFFTGSLLTYLVGLVPALVAMGLIAPGKRNIEKRQEQLDQLGSPLSLGRALTESSR